MADGIQWDEEEGSAPAGVAWDDAPAAAPAKPDAARAALLGFAQGGTYNYADELGGLVGKLLIPEGVKANTAPQAGDTPEITATKARIAKQQAAVPTSYALTRDLMRKEAEDAAGEHFWEYLGGNVGGEIAKDIALSRLGVPVESTGFDIASGAMSGSGAADENTPGGKFGGAALGALAGHFGGAVGAKFVGPAVGYVGRKADEVATKLIPESVREFAAKQALKASGYIQKDIKPLARRDPEQLVEHGEELLRAGTVRPFRTVEDVAESAEAEVAKYGDAIGKTLQAADAVGAKFNMGRFVKRAREEVLAPLLDDPAVAPEAKQLADLLDDYGGLPVGSVGFEKANRMKGNLQSKINWGNQWNDAKANIPNELKMKLQHIFLEEVDDQLGDAFGSMGQPGKQIRDAFKEVKRRYGIHAQSLDKARMGMAREAGNDFVSGKDMMIGSGVSGGGAAAAFASGSPGLAMASIGLGGVAALANKLLRERGASTAAVGASKLASTLESIATSRPTQWLAKVPAQQLERYAGPLASAALRGPQALSATIFALSQQDPDFRAMQQNAQGQ